MAKKKKSIKKKNQPHENQAHQSSRLAWGLGSGIVLVQLFDVIIHIATGQAEPVRIIASLIIMSWAGWVLTRHIGKRFVLIGQTMLTLYIVLNIVFLNGAGFVNLSLGNAPRTMLFVLVTITMILSTWLYAIQKTAEDKVNDAAI